MSSYSAVHAVGNTLIRFLRETYETAPPPEIQNTCEFRLLSSTNLTDADNMTPPTLSLYLYRMTLNQFMRNAQPQQSRNRRPMPLTLDLHYLLTVWADGAEEEQTLITWAMRQLHQFPMLDTSSLPGEVWHVEDYVQVAPVELSNEDMMRIWDALEPSYRLSFPYVARAVRIDPDAIPDSLPVVETQFVWQQLADQQGATPS